MRKKKAGRKDEGRTERVTILFTEDERALLDYVCDNTATTISTIGRASILSHAGEIAEQIRSGNLGAFRSPAVFKNTSIKPKED